MPQKIISLSVDSVIQDKACYKFTLLAAVTRSDSEGLSYEDLEEGLQTDLETLLAAVAKRMRLLENEIQTLVTWQDKKDKKATTTTGKMVSYIH